MSDGFLLISVPRRDNHFRERLFASARGRGTMFSRAWVDEWLDPPKQHWKSAPLPNHWPIEMPLHDVLEFKTWGPRAKTPRCATAMLQAMKALGYE